MSNYDEEGRSISSQSALTPNRMELWHDLVPIILMEWLAETIDLIIIFIIKSMAEKESDFSDLTYE
mgnify:FL=1